MVTTNFKYYDNLAGEKILLRDYAHASALFRRNDYRLMPKSKFLYHVNININQTALSSLGTRVANVLKGKEFNLLTTQADLPSFNLSVDTKNQYNRKKLIQTRIDYDPINISFHDDNAGLTTLLWEAYFRYYYQDANYRNEFTTAYNDTSLYKQSTFNYYRYGLDKEGATTAAGYKIPFFDTIKIYQLHPQYGKSKYTEYILVNPLIQNWQHDNVDYGDTSGLTSSTMRIAYETVLYNRDETDEDNPGMFATAEHYDIRKSTLRTGDTASSVSVDLNETFGEWFSDIVSDIVFRDSQVEGLAGLQANEAETAPEEGDLVSTATSSVNTDIGSTGVTFITSNNSNDNVTKAEGSTQVDYATALLALTGYNSVTEALQAITSSSSAADDFGFALSRTLPEEIFVGNDIPQEDVDSFETYIDTAVTNFPETITDAQAAALAQISSNPNISRVDVEAELKDLVKAARKLNKDMSAVGSLPEKRKLWNSAPEDVKQTFVKIGFRALANVKRGAPRPASSIIG
jgi:hypothetical protein